MPLFPLVSNKGPWVPIWHRVPQTVLWALCHQLRMLPFFKAYAVTKRWSSGKSRSLLEGCKWYRTSAISLTASYKVIYTPPLKSSNPTPGYLCKCNENSCSHKNLYVDIYSGFIHGYPKRETTPCPLTGKWINKLWCIHAVKYSSAVKNSCPQTHGHNGDGTQAPVLSERSQAQKAHTI